MSDSGDLREQIDNASDLMRDLADRPDFPAAVRMACVRAGEAIAKVQAHMTKQEIAARRQAIKKGAGA